MIEWRTLGTILVLVAGAGLFLRLIAKEVRRRNNYLKVRLEKERHEAELEENRRKLEQEGRGRRDQPGSPSEGGETDAVTVVGVRPTA